MRMRILIMDDFSTSEVFSKNFNRIATRIATRIAIRIARIIETRIATRIAIRLLYNRLEKYYRVGMEETTQEDISRNVTA